MSEEPTKFLEKKYPLLKAVLDYALKRIEIAVALAFVGVGTSVYNHQDAKHEVQTEWPVQVGDHLQDLLLTNNIQEKEIQELRNQIWALQNPLAAKLNKTNFTEADLNKIMDEVDKEMANKYK